MFKINWDNGHACGQFPQGYETEEAAEEAGKDWLAEMIAMDPDPVGAAEAYTYEVVEESAS